MLNIRKTEALWIGVSCHKQAIKILGVFISNDIDLAIDLKLKERINTIRSVINNWKRRNLTLFGKIVVLKTFIISQFQYVLSATHIPEKYIEEINDICSPFYGMGKRLKLRNLYCASQGLTGV